VSTLLVTRHVGTIDWLERQGFRVEKVLQHLDIDSVLTGDKVVGNLPIQLAAEVCEKGGRYFHLEVAVPFEYRGKELSAELLDEFNAQISEFKITRVVDGA